MNQSIRETDLEPREPSHETLVDVHYQAVLLAGVLETVAAIQNSGEGDLAAMVEVAAERGRALADLIERAESGAYRSTVAEPSPEATPDKHPEWLREWRAAHRGFTQAANKPDGGNFDSPDCKKFIAERDRLQENLTRTPARTGEGMAAQIEYALEDGLIGGVSHDGSDCQMFLGIIATLKGGAA